jgi:hypothetical protein
MMGGTAGGIKYFHEDILFKFPVDAYNLYGGQPESQMKAYGHEFKGMMSYIDCRIKDLHFPLMVLIDYRFEPTAHFFASNDVLVTDRHVGGICNSGWRILAESLLPLGRDTIIYGTCDGGSTIHASVPEMNDKMELAAKIMNLQGEYVYNYSKEERTMLHASCDVEGHLGRDNRFYVVDTARVMPPAPPRDRYRCVSIYNCVRSTDCLTSERFRKSNTILYRLLRPELVKANPVPLCADSFSGFYLQNRERHNDEVAAAVERLEKTLIPDFASQFELQFLQKHSEEEYEPSDEDFVSLINSLHRNGINVRYLGVVRFVLSKFLFVCWRLFNGNKFLLLHT